MTANGLKSESVRFVRERAGVSLAEARRALEATEGDRDLALGYLRYVNAAVNVRGDRHAWVMAQARAWVDRGGDGLLRKHAGELDNSLG